MAGHCDFCADRVEAWSQQRWVLSLDAVEQSIPQTSNGKEETNEWALLLVGGLETG